MSNGLGAGFFWLALLAVLLGLAAGLTLALLGTVAVRRRNGTVPRWLNYISIVVLSGVLVVAGFGVLAMYDEAVLLAVILLLLVFVPLAAVGTYLHLTTDLPRLDAIATIGLAWSVPFVLGVGATFGLTLWISSMFSLAPAEARGLGVVWLSMLAGGAIAVSGAMLIARYLSRSLGSPPAM